MKFRVHHILCTCLYKGYGYSGAFCENMTQKVTYLKEHCDEKIMLITNPDDICENCPNLNREDESCTNGDNHVHCKDQELLSIFGLEENTWYTYRELVTIARQKLSKDAFDSSCSNCEWYQQGLCSYEKFMDAKMFDKMVRINENLFYIPASEDPLSANVVVVETKDSIWVYDVGASEYIPEILTSMKKPVNVILSHFHPDHIRNLTKIDAVRVLQGKNTYGYTKVGEVVESDLRWEEAGVSFHVFPIPSCHAKGSLGLEINETYCFVGDATYPTAKRGQGLYNAGVLLDEIRVLEKVKARQFALSHKEPFLVEKEEVLSELRQIYGRRKQGEPYIYLK